MNTHYEWDVETVDEFGDIIDHNFLEKLKDVQPLQEDEQLVLVKTTDSERGWAYVKFGKLPEVFKDSYGNDIGNVPKAYKTEFEKYKNQL